MVLDLERATKPSVVEVHLIFLHEEVKSKRKLARQESGTV